MNKITEELMQLVDWTSKVEPYVAQYVQRDVNAKVIEYRVEMYTLTQMVLIVVLRCDNTNLMSTVNIPLVRGETCTNWMRVMTAIRSRAFADCL